MEMNHIFCNNKEGGITVIFFSKCTMGTKLFSFLKYSRNNAKLKRKESVNLMIRVKRKPVRAGKNLRW